MKLSLLRNRIFDLFGYCITCVLVVAQFPQKIFVFRRALFLVLAMTGSFLPMIQARVYPTLFLHGLHAGPLQAAKYIHKHIASATGETILSRWAINVLSEPLVAPVFGEISLRNRKTDSYSKRVVCGITFLLDKKVLGYEVQEKASSTGFTLAGRGLNIFNNNFGQQADLDVIKLAYETHKQAYPDDKMLVWGCSRGAAAACTFICTESDAADHIQLVVLEGCFDSSVSVIEKRFKRFGKGGIKRIKKFFEKRTYWRQNGISPLAVLDKWPDNVPVLFVTSRKDTVVPMECAINCAKKLKALKPNLDVYLLVLENSSHSGYAIDNYADRVLYENVVNAFYQKYGWKHDAIKAALGSCDLEKIKL